MIQVRTNFAAFLIATAGIFMALSGAAAAQANGAQTQVPAGIEALATFQTATAYVPAGQAQGLGSGQGQEQGSGQGQGRRGRGMDGFPGGGRGVLGTVTEVAADHYTIKTDAGETYTVHYSVNTRIVKQGEGRRGSGAGRGGDSEAGQGERAQPVTLKPTDIKAGDIITAGGEVDEAGKSIGAVFIAQIDPERAKQMREMQANYGKTWLAGRITAIEGTTITIDGMIDHAKHTIAVDENTSFRKRRDSITMADIQPGEQLRAEGAVKEGVFLATVVNATEARNREQTPGLPAAAPGSQQSPPQ
jgi:preprotein translocase subunit YajC